MNRGAGDPFAALPPDAAQLAERWSAAVWSPDIDAAVRAIYDDVAAETAALQPVCNASGRCCRFATSMSSTYYNYIKRSIKHVLFVSRGTYQ